MLLAKLEVYGLDNNPVIFMKRYLTNRLQQRKINNSFSECVKTSAGIQHGSILGLLLFNISINGILFIRKCDLTNYAYESTIYTSK